MADYWVKSGTGGTDAGTSWANAAESIAGLMTAQAIAGGDTIYVHNTHNFNAGAAITWTLPESGTGLVRVLCVDGGDATGASLVDGTVGNLTTGATENTNGNFAFTINTVASGSAGLYVHGINIQAGSGASQTSADIVLGANAGRLTFNACNFWCNTTSVSGEYLLTNGAGTWLTFHNCTFRFGATGQGFQVGSGRYRFANCSINASGSSPTTLFEAEQGTVRATWLECHSCDWSLATNVWNAAITASGKALFSNCVIATPTTGTHTLAGCEAEFHACDPVDGANGANILSYFMSIGAGTVQDNQSVYKATSGAQGEQDDGTDTSYSLQMDPSASVSTAFPLYTPWVYVLVGSTGSKTVAMKVAHTESAVLTNQDIFMEVEYMGEPGATGTQRVANSPMSFLEVDDSAPVISGTVFRDISATASNRTDDALDDWTGLTGEKEHTLTATVTCDEVGYIRCRVGLTKDTTNPVYVDPKISVT